MNPIKTSLALMAVLPALIAGCRSRLPGDSRRSTLELFQNPPVEYRSAPLWVWNDSVTPARIDEQLEEFEDKGVGGVFIHPRPGLITPYLSEEWFALCRHAVEKAKELGIKVWIYDENSYPSGFAGGHVPDQMPDSARKSLVMNKVTRLPESGGPPPILVLQSTAGGFRDITASTKDEPAEGPFYLFFLVEQEPSPWYGGYTYVDLLRRDVTEKFLAVTLDAYKNAIGGEFGTTVPGVFQDEAHVGPVDRRTVTYTPALFEEFQGMWDYDLKPNLPSLFEDIGDWRKVRHDYYAVIHHLFIENWGKVYAGYCEANGLDWTGHYWEHEWPNPRLVPDNMAMSACAQIPGIDILENDWRTGPDGQFGNARSVKEIRSAANQLGRKRTLSETYGASGWDLTFFDQKRIGDWEYALGVNFLNQHLSYMTLKGSRKRDHPLSFSYHEPWWYAYRVLGDYFGRLSVALSRGEQKNPILVLEPTTTAWMYYAPGRDNERLEALGRDFQEFVNRLEARQIEYDLGSESILEEIGAVSEKSLVVGERSYALVVLPPGLENLNNTTVGLVGDFLRAGGRVLSWVEPPGYVDGRASGEPAELAASCGDGWTTVTGGGGWEALRNLCPPPLDFPGADRIDGRLFHHRRELRDAELVFLVNSDTRNKASGRFYSERPSPFDFRSCETWNPFTGEVKPYASIHEAGRLAVDFDLPPGGSLLLCLRRGEAENPDFAAAAESPLPARGELSVRRLSPNVLILDYCDLHLENKTGRNLYFYDAQKRIFRAHGLEGNPWDSAVQFDTGILDLDRYPAGSGFGADYWFEVAEGVNPSGLKCVVERPELFSVSCNGTELQPVEGGWWLDRDFGVFDIGGTATPGENRITLEAEPFTIHTELEPVYILGDFDLESQSRGFRLVPAMKKKPGSWKSQGMPFYSGGVNYEKDVLVPSDGKSEERIMVRLGRFAGSIAEVMVNGRSAGFIAFEPFQLDITGLIQPGTNRVGVVVYGTLKNTLGPHHNSPTLGKAWPSQFQRGAENGRPPGSEYSLVDYGLLEDFVVVARKKRGHPEV